MARSSKIVCILILCACLTALCAVGAFAEPVELTTSYYSWFIYVKQLDNNQVTNTYERLLSRTGVSLSSLYATNLSPLRDPHYILSYKIAENSESNSFLSFEPGYTYTGSFQVNWNNPTNPADNPSLPTSLDPTDGEYNIHLSLNADPWADSFANTVTTTIAESPFEGVCGVTDLSDNYVDHNLAFTVSFAFHVPDDFTFDSYQFLSLDALFSREGAKPTGTYDYVAIVPTAVSCFYDPDAGIIESETDKIIAGQLAAVQQAQQNELNATNTAASSNTDAAMNQASSAFNFSSFSGALAGLVSALGYTGSDFHFYLPAADNIPYIGSLWSQQEIPLKTMIDSIPVGLLYVLRFLAWLALIFSVVHFIRKLVSDVNGGGDD